MWDFDRGDIHIPHERTPISLETKRKIDEAVKKFNYQAICSPATSP